MPATFTDNSGKVLSELERLKKAALEAVGGQAVTHAKNTVASAGRVDTGAMRNEISQKIVDGKCYVGTNTKYAIYHEMGTGIHIAGGRKTPWAYQDAHGEWHWTRGLRPIHMIKNAVANHVNEYRAIVERILKGG